jgi:hypothetical protein
MGQAIENNVNKRTITNLGFIVSSFPPAYFMGIKMPVGKCA